MYSLKQSDDVILKLWVQAFGVAPTFVVVAAN